MSYTPPLLFPAAVAELKATTPREDIEKRYARVLRRFYDDAFVIVEARIGDGKAAESYLAGIQKILSAELLRLHISVTSEIGRAVLSTYRPQRVLSWLRLHAEGDGERITVSLLEEIQATQHSLRQGVTMLAAVTELFTRKRTSDTVRLAETMTTTMVARGAVEAGKQAIEGGNKVTKTWRVNSTNPRPSHARLDGRTIGIEERFPNGMLHPGDPAGGIDETAGCKCRLTVKIEEV